MNVLLVDDDLQFRVQLKRLLEKKFNIKVFEAENGAAGLEYLKEGKADTIFLDYEMPEMNAGQFMSKLRKLYNNIPVVIITAHSDKEIVKELIPFGIKDYIIKADVNCKLADRLDQIFSFQRNNDNVIKVLLVEDDSKFRVLMKRLLEKEFSSLVTEAQDGLHGIESIKNTDADIIFLDYDMPNMNGKQFLEKLREFNKNIPVVIITAHGDKKILSELLPYQITDYIIKADMITKLTERIGQIFKKCCLSYPYSGKNV